MALVVKFKIALAVREKVAGAGAGAGIGGGSVNGGDEDLIGNGDSSLPNQSPFIAPHRSLQVPCFFFSCIRCLQVLHAAWGFLLSFVAFRSTSSDVVRTVRYCIVTVAVLYYTVLHCTVLQCYVPLN